MRQTLAFLAIAGLAALPASAGTAQIGAGHYITEGGWGQLTIKPGEFSIDAVGANGHTCGLEGELHGFSGFIASDSGDQKGACRINISQSADGGVNVSATTEDACRTYCGARAGFEGDYFRPAAGCDDRERAATRGAFKTKFDAGAYAEALARLRRLLAGCAKTLYWLDAGWIRNDLALTQYRLGDRRACIETLRPLAQEAAMSDDTLEGKYPPADYESYLPIIKATRANLALCRKG